MTDRTLSPTAQAIYDAFNRIGLYNEPSFETDRKALAAALRAAAEQVESDTSKSITDEKSRMWYQLGRRAAVEQLVSLAAELETQ